jgi:hypothetical protein
MSPRTYVILIIIGYLLILMYAYCRYDVAPRPRPIAIADAIAEPFQDLQAPPIDGTNFSINGVRTRGRLADMPSFAELRDKVRLPECNKLLDPSTVNGVDLGDTVGSYCQYITASDPILAIRKTLIGLAKDLNGYSFSGFNLALPKTANPAAPSFISFNPVDSESTTLSVINTDNLPVKYTKTTTTRPSTRFENLGTLYATENRPTELMPRTIRALEAYVIYDTGYSTNDQGIRARLVNFNPDTYAAENIVNVTPYILSKLQFKDIIALPEFNASLEPIMNKNIYDSLTAKGLKNIGTGDLRLSYVATHPLLKEPYQQGIPDLFSTTDNPGTINISLTRGQTNPSFDIAMATQNRCPNMFTMLYSTAGGRIVAKPNQTVPFASWSFPRATVFNASNNVPANQLNESNSKIQEALMSYLRQDIYLEFMNLGAPNDSIKWSDDLMRYVRTQKASVADRSSSLTMVMRWKLDGDQGWTYGYHNDNSYKKIIISSLGNIGTKLSRTYVSRPVLDYSIEYSFSICMKITSLSKQLRNIISHGSQYSYPALSIVGDNNTPMANMPVLCIMTQDDFRPMGQVIPIDLSGIGSAEQPGLGQWIALTVTLNGREGKIYLISNPIDNNESNPQFNQQTVNRRVVVSDFTLSRKAIWPFKNEPLMFARKDIGDPSAIGVETVDCSCEPPAAKTAFDGLSVAKFFWYPVELSRAYIETNIFPDPRIDQLPGITTRFTTDVGQAFVPEPTFFEYKTPGSHSFYVPANVTLVRVTAIGGGGGGSNTAGSSKTGYGGNAGQQIVNRLIPVIPGRIIRMTVGAGGAGANGPKTANNNGIEGNAGGKTEIPDFGISLNGGAGGQLTAINGMWQSPNGQDMVINGNRIGVGGAAYVGLTPLDRLRLNASGVGAGGGNVDNGRNGVLFNTTGLGDAGDQSVNIKAGDGAPGYIKIEWDFQ